MDVDSRSSLEPLTPGRRSDRIRFYGQGRVCAQPGCTTLLSMYNPSSRCAVHQRRSDAIPLRRLESQEVERGCSQCGARFLTTNPRRKYCSARCRSHACAERERAARLSVDLRERAAA